MNRTLITAVIVMTLLVMGATFFLGRQSNTAQAAANASTAEVTLGTTTLSDPTNAELQQAYQAELARQTQRIREEYQRQLEQKVRELQQQYQSSANGSSGQVDPQTVEALRQQYEQQLQSLQNAYAQRELIYQAQLQEAARRLNEANARIEALSQQVNQANSAPRSGERFENEHEGQEHNASSLFFTTEGEHDDD